ncbi:MAG: ATP synthase F1 subunit epsilon [Bacteroidetes bacterium]|nr:ATP synthase F1 subunit epsilon [Bacteroidota bacterium]
MYLEIVTPDKKIYEGEIKLIQVPGSKGSFEVMYNHAPLISTIEKGSIKVIEESEKKIYFDIEGGVIEVLKNKVIILAEVI